MPKVKLTLPNVAMLALLALSLASEKAASADDPLCKVEDNRGDPFKLTIVEVKKVLSVICAEDGRKYTTTELDAMTQPALDIARRESHTLLGEYTHKVEPWFGPLWSYKGSPPDLTVQYPKRAILNLPVMREFQVNGIGISIINNEELVECDSKHRNCLAKYRALNYLIDRLGASFRSEKIDRWLQHVAALDADWAQFTKEARSQTFTDIWLTTFLYNRTENFDHYLQGPPKTQYFTLHPSIIIENVSDALDGEQLNEAIAIEVIGFNRWKGAMVCFGLPCGASVIATYSDRPDIKESGWGLMVHLDNKYSFGATKHGKHTGFFVTLDLLKIFESKKTQIEAYRKSIKGSFD